MATLRGWLNRTFRCRHCGGIYHGVKMLVRRLRCARCQTCGRASRRRICGSCWSVLGLGDDGE